MVSKIKLSVYLKTIYFKKIKNVVNLFLLCRDCERTIAPYCGYGTWLLILTVAVTQSSKAMMSKQNFNLREPVKNLSENKVLTLLVLLAFK